MPVTYPNAVKIARMGAVAAQADAGEGCPSSVTITVPAGRLD